MQSCNCRRVRAQAQEGEYAFLASQLERCEACVYNKEAPRSRVATYDAVRLNYVVAYWKQQRI